MTPAQLAAVSFLARYSGPTHHLYAYQLRRWFAWCETNGLDALLGIERAHIELYIRHLGDAGLMSSSINTMMHGVRGYFRLAHIDGVTPSDPCGLRPTTRGPPRRDPHPRPRPARAHPLPTSCADDHRSPRGAGLSPRHQRAPSLRSCCGANRGLRRDAARPPRPPPRRQRQ
ncbi:site-specific integrase [Nocardioides sp.]|uniref:site-specific integrase n=1 Tax=Nocardioides sp. TaxID=35761 RepID=UPI00345CE118